MASLLSLDSVVTLDAVPSADALGGPTSPKRSPLSRRPSRIDQSLRSTSPNPPPTPSSPRHPLRLSPRLDAEVVTGSSSGSTLAAGPSSVRSRKQPVEADVTRPTLQRITSQAAKKSATPYRDELSPTGLGLSGGPRRSLDELARASGSLTQERDVVVHQVSTWDSVWQVASHVLTRVAPFADSQDRHDRVHLAALRHHSQSAAHPSPGSSKGFPIKLTAHSSHSRKRSASRTGSGRPTRSTSAATSTSRSTSATSHPPPASAASPGRQAADLCCGRRTRPRQHHRHRRATCWRPHRMERDTPPRPSTASAKRGRTEGSSARGLGGSSARR